MTQNPPTATRRHLLASVGVGITGLAGCAGFDLPWEVSEPEYDVKALTALEDRSLPDIPEPVEVALPAGLLEDFDTRTQTHLERVPAAPSVPNEVVARRLAEERDRVASHLDDPVEHDTIFDRLGSARYRLGRAAEIDAAYRAAKDQLDLDAVRREYAGLRDDLHSFLRSWDYRGPGPLEALVFHRRLEDVIAEAKRAARPGETLPDDPAHAPFRVGSIVGEITRGRAALETARQLRGQFIEGLDPPPAFRTVIIPRAYQVDRLFRESGARLRDYFEEFGRRDIEGHGSPAEFLFREAEVSVTRVRDAVERSRNHERFAQAVVDGGHIPATHQSSRRAIDLVRNETFPTPRTAGGVVAEFETAVSALESAIEAEPQTLAPVLAWPARDHLENGVRRLNDPDRYPIAVYQATASFRFARLYATAVPGAARVVAGWFGE